MTGTIWTVNSGTTAITVPASMAKLRFWRNTRVAELTAGVATLAPDTLGYEWDEDLDNGARPAGIDAPVVDDGDRRREDPRLRRDRRHRHRDA